jgi:hypothetical protein
MLLLWSGLAAPSQLGGKHTTHTRLRLRVTWMERVRRRVGWRWCCWAKKRFFFFVAQPKTKTRGRAWRHARWWMSSDTEALLSVYRM